MALLASSAFIIFIHHLHSPQGTLDMSYTHRAPSEPRFGSQAYPDSFPCGISEQNDLT